MFRHTGFYHDLSLFTSPVTNIHAGAPYTGIVRESACGGGTQEDWSNQIFGRVRVKTQAICAAVMLYPLHYALLCNLLNKNSLLWSCSNKALTFLQLAKLSNDVYNDNRQRLPRGEWSQINAFISFAQRWHLAISSCFICFVTLLAATALRVKANSDQLHRIELFKQQMLLQVSMTTYIIYYSKMVLSSQLNILSCQISAKQQCREPFLVST